MRTHNAESQGSMTPAKALQYLKEGNARFVNNVKANRNLLQQVNETRVGQWPFATILSCIDSRTSAELIFDQGLGDVFSIRVAGNIVNTDILGSLEFACRIAGSKLIVVLGHTDCGAIKGACDHLEMGNLSELLSKIEVSVYEERKSATHGEFHSKNREFVDAVTDRNIRRAVRSIVNRSVILEQLMAEEQIAIIGAKYGLDSGTVDFFEDTWIADHGSVTRCLAGTQSA